MRSTARNDVKRHTEDKSPKYRMVGNDVGLESPTYRSFKFWYSDFCSSLRANAKQSRKTVITRSDKRRSNRIHIEKDEIATFRYTPLAMTDVGKKVLYLGGHKFEPVKHCEPCETACRMAELERGCNNEDNALLEPSPEFLSSSQLTKKFNPLTEREGKSLAASLLSRLAAFTLAEGATHVAHWNNSLKIAFTLAEVLVTLGIIGVVSAMTVPTLMQNYQRQSYVTQLHKVYNEMSQALLRYQTDKNAVNLREAGLTSANAVNSFITTYLKVVKDCGNDFSACFGSDYKKINGTSLSFGEASSAAGVFVLAGGQAIAIFSRNSDSQQYSNSIATILVDVNGKKGPNIQGRDFYQMDIYSTDGGPVIDEMIWNVTQQPPFTEAQRNTQFNSYCVAGGSGNFHGCFGKILNDNWQMNY